MKGYKKPSCIHPLDGTEALEIVAKAMGLDTEELIKGIQWRS
jgi:hypothetical protein